MEALSKEKISFIEFIDLGLVDFKQALNYQQSRAEGIFSGSNPEQIIFCEHPPCVVLGKRQSRSIEWEKFDIPVFESDRGGLQTAHYPGQIVCYPILNLRRRSLGVKSYMESLTSAVFLAISSLDENSLFKVDKERFAILDKNKSKVASFAVKVSRGVSTFGFSVNVSGEHNLLNKINACGLDGSYASLDCGATTPLRNKIKKNLYQELQILLG